MGFKIDEYEEIDDISELIPNKPDIQDMSEPFKPDDEQWSGLINRVLSENAIILKKKKLAQIEADLLEEDDIELADHNLDDTLVEIDFGETQIKNIYDVPDGIKDIMADGIIPELKKNR